MVKKERSTESSNQQEKFYLYENLLLYMKLSGRFARNLFKQQVRIEMSAKVAVVGAGPSGCYLAQSLRKALPDSELTVMDRLPVPYGLVRYGVAPDHQGTKAVIKQFARLFERDCVAFCGNLMLGRDLSLEDLQNMFDVVVLATGLSKDRNLGKAFTDVAGLYGAGEITRYWNGHPDAAGDSPEFGRKVIVIGNGNVAIDVVRLLAKQPEDFAGSDIAGSSLGDGIETIAMVGRSGVAKAKFDAAMVRELGKVNGLKITAADPLPDPDNNIAVTAMHDIVSKTDGTIKSLSLHFDSTPIRPVIENDVLKAVVFDFNGTERVIPCDSVITAVGFEDGDGTLRDALLTEAIDLDQGHLRPGLYATGWFRRGPQGTIAQNRVDAKAVAARIVQNLQPDDKKPGRAALCDRFGHVMTTYADWLAIDAAECANAPDDRVRQKITTVPEMLAHRS